MSDERDYVLHAFTIPFGVGFGQLINSATDLVYSKTKDGTFSHCRLRIYDQNMIEMKIIDPNMLIVLSFLNVES
jgi:SOS-response transcriptional repressor LexA